MKTEMWRKVFLVAAAVLLVSGPSVKAEELQDGEGIVSGTDAMEEEKAASEDGVTEKMRDACYGAAGVYASGESYDIEWSIDMNGKLVLSGNGNWWSGEGYPVPIWCSYCSAVKSANVNIAGLTYAWYMFQNCGNLTKVDLRSFDSSNVTNMSYMFNNCLSLKDLDLNSLDTSGVTNMSHMFEGCSNLKTLNLSNFTISFVTDTTDMFEGCDNLELINAPKNVGTDVLLPTVPGYVWRLPDGTETKILPRDMEHSVELRRYEKGYASYDGFEFFRDDNGNITCKDGLGRLVTNAFKCDGVYTYYFQADGTAMKNRLTYHPDGVHVIYFDEEGHEVFSDFANVKKTIAGESVDDYCFFDVYGYLYVDVVTYDKAGRELYYANPYGVLERNGWFQFSQTVKCADGTPWPGAAGGYGYAKPDGTLLKNTYVYDWEGRYCYMQGNGVALYQ